VTWQVVVPPQDRASIGRVGYASRRTATLAVASDFADSGVMLMTINRSSGSPTSATCVLYWTADGGDTWSSRGEVSSYGSCNGLRTGGGPRMAMWMVSTSGVYGWRMTRDGGLTEGSFGAFEPAGGPDAPAAVGQDGTLLAIGRSGLWTLGPSAARTDGRLPCSIQEGEPYRSAWMAAVRARVALGCPSGEPYTVTVHERRVGDVRDLWLDDERAEWLSLQPPERRADRPQSGSGRALRQSKAGMPWSGVADRAIDAEAQPYVGGIIVRLSEPDGRRILLVVGSGWDLVLEEWSS
jgi:hypothetical protein